LVIHSSTIDESQIYQTGWEEQLDLLMCNASRMLDDVKQWLTIEAEPLFSSYSSSTKVIEEDINYPDIIAGVLDCVAHTTLLNIDKVLRFLRRARLRSGSLEGRSEQQELENSQLLGDPDIIERWRQRAVKAFEFVQGESQLAAKPLDFGLRQIQSSGSSSSINISAR
jgi:hypothetical protein